MKRLTDLLVRYKHKRAVLILLAVIIIAGVLLAIVVNGGANEEIAYRETVVEKGDLVVGITESGSVDVGTVNQVFELDMSALQRAETGNNTSNSGGGAGNGGAMTSGAAGGFGGNMMSAGGGASGGGNTAGGMNMFGQIFDMAGAGSNTSTGTIGNLAVAEVLVSVGQQVQEGDVLYLLEKAGVTELQNELQSNVEKAEADLNAVYADQKLSKQTAQYTYDTSMAYGNYAVTEYNTSIQTLSSEVSEAEKELERAKALLVSYQEQLEQTKADYEAACKVQANCEWSRDNTNKWDSTYLYVMYFEQAQSAKSNADSLGQKVEQLERNVEQAGQNVTSCEQALNTAKRNLASGKLTAQETRSLRQLAFDTAQETYDIALEYLEDSAREQEETYIDAKEKWEEFSSHIDGNAVKAKYNGVITEVSLAEGDAIETGDVLVALYDMDEVSMTVSVDEDDMSDISVGGIAKVSYTAYPDTIFQASITEIGDAETDSSGNVTYQVTITLEGDVSGLFQGMTGDITFITKETREVLYVSNRAIIREGTSSYVKVRDDKGNIRKKEVVCGFSDGVNVEILEGLSEGDVVLVESKVSES